MRRICFDTESNYFKPGQTVGDIDYHRSVMARWRRTNQIRLDCAVLYDEATDHYEEFRAADIASLVARLGEADELISHSGRRHDLVILEAALGATAVASLFEIPHHDLFEMAAWSSLAAIIRGR